MVDPDGSEHPKSTVASPSRPPAPSSPYSHSNGAVGPTMTDGPPKPPRGADGRAGWPIACSLLLLAQFLERLSFAYVQAVFMPHLTANLGMDPGMANASLQLLIQITFFAAFVGGLLADAKYGKYGTLIWLFPAYLLGQLLITASPILPAQKFLHPYFDYFALFIMAYGCGCVRGVLPAYGADQIWPPNVPQLGCFFALFYAQEHLAFICSSLALPFLKNLILWPLPTDKPFLGVLFLSVTILWMSIAILIGASRYFRQTLPQGQNVFSRSWYTIGHALHNKKRHHQKRLVTAKTQSGPPPKNLLDHFLDDHNCERDKECDFGRRQVCGQAKFLAELKSALRMFLVLSLLPLFWAFQSQLVSISIVQAQSVDPRLPFIGPLLPIDQLCLLPHLLVLLLIPLFYLFLFPSSSISQCLSLNTYLRRMSIGIFLFAFASSFASSVQMLLNMAPSPPIKSSPDSALFKLFNTFPADCSLSLSRVALSGDEFQQVNANTSSRPIPLLPGEIAAGFADFQFRFNGSSCAGHRKSRIRIWTKTGKLNLAVVGPQGILWTALDPRMALQSSLGVLALLPCNSLDSPLPVECANMTGDPLAQALTPFASGLSLCPSNAQQSIQSADNSSSSSSSLPPPSPSSCTATWTADEAILSQFFLFPPRGDNLGMGKGSLYEPKVVPAGTYKLTLNPSLADASSVPLTDTNDTSNAAAAPSDAASPPLSPPPPSSDSSGNSSIGNGLQQDFTVDDSGSISLLLLSLDGSPLAGQNDSSPRPNPTLSVLLLAGPASLNILWLLPQHLLMAAAEVLLSVTALEFCYVQAPNALKSTMIGYWYLLIYVGMSISPQLAKLQFFTDSAYQLLLTSFSLFSVGLAFTLMAHFFFKYRDNLTGASDGGQRPKDVEGLAEKLEGTLRASMARLPTKKVIRL